MTKSQKADWFVRRLTHCKQAFVRAQALVFWQRIHTRYYHGRQALVRGVGCGAAWEEAAQQPVVAVTSTCTAHFVLHTIQDSGRLCRTTHF